MSDKGKLKNTIAPYNSGPKGLQPRPASFAPTSFAAVAEQLDYVSYAEFLDWADEDTLAEWVDGKIVMTSPASYNHQQILRFLNGVLDIFVRVNDLGTLILPPFQMRLPGSGREPDLIFVSKSHLAQIQNSFVQGPADLAVEIISPESVARDREDKFGEYAAGNVPEYWLIDATENQAQFYQLNVNGQYQSVALDAEGKYHSKVLPGLWLRPHWLWQQPLPDLEDILLEVSAATYARFLRQKLETHGL